MRWLFLKGKVVGDGRRGTAVQIVQEGSLVLQESPILTARTVYQPPVPSSTSGLFRQGHALLMTFMADRENVELRLAGLTATYFQG